MGLTPWRLTDEDRRLLRRLRIQVDDEPEPPRQPLLPPTAEDPDCGGVDHPRR